MKKAKVISLTGWLIFGVLSLVAFITLRYRYIVVGFAIRLTALIFEKYDDVEDPFPSGEEEESQDQTDILEYVSIEAEEIQKQSG